MRTPGFASAKQEGLATRQVVTKFAVAVGNLPQYVPNGQSWPEEHAKEIPASAESVSGWWYAQA